MRFSYHYLSSSATAVAVWLCMLPLSDLISGRAWLVEATGLIVVSAVIGLVVNLLRAPRTVTLLAQLIGILGVVGWRGLALSAAGDGGSNSFEGLLVEGVTAIRSGVPPLDSSPALTWLCVLFAATLLIVVELLVNALEQPAWSMAALALPFGISALTLSADLPWLHVLPVAAGYLLLLFSATGAPAATGSVSRRTSYESSRFGISAVLGAGALSLALVIGFILPLGAKQPWSASGQNGPIQLTDPTIQLEEDLRRPEDTPVLSYRSDDGQPHYLRTVALSDFGSGGARLVPMKLNRTGLEGASERSGDPVQFEISMDAVRSEYLPAPYSPRSFSAEGSWSFDPATLSIVATGPDRTAQTIDLQYSIDSVIPDFSREQIEAAGAGQGVDGINLAVPEVSDQVTELAKSVSGGAQTAGQKALAIEAWLRSDAFTYSLDAPNSSGTGVIDSFLLLDRSGYCIHFAAAMVTLSRIEGIPARMAVGFNSGEQLDDGSFQVTAHDAHAWPELFLDGLGWVAFEPTPAFAPGTDPGPEETPTATPSGPTSASPTPTAAATPTTTPSAAPLPPSQQGGGTMLVTLAWIALVLLLVLAATPWAIRLATRSLRLRQGQDPHVAAAAAWREAEALFADYRLPWPTGSPGPAARAASSDLPQQGAAALTALAAQVEGSRFARDVTPTSQVAVQTKALRHAIDKAATPGTRLRARMLPQSLWQLGLKLGEH